MRHIWFVLTGTGLLIAAGCGESPHYLNIDAGDVDAGVDAEHVDAAPDASVPDAMPGPDAGLPPGMIYVPTGSFGMGCDITVEGACSNSNELPLHDVSVSSFLIDEREVSRADYQGCVDAGVCLALAGQAASSLPSAAPWQNASSYCVWMGKRLPSEAEWEYAARGSDHRRYPWGNSAPSCDRAAYSDCGGGYEAVTENVQGASPFGLINMAGNAAEWVKDWYSETYYANSPSTDPQGPSSGTYKLVRGGSGADPASSIRTAVRSSKASTALYGYRCAKDYP